MLEPLRLLYGGVAVVALAVSACSSGGSSSSPDAGLGDASVSDGGAAGKGTGGVGTGGKATGGRGNGGVTGNGGAPSMGGAQETGGVSNESGGTPGDGGKAGDGGSGGKDASTDASPCGTCPSGVCLADGGCAECGADKDCHAPSPRCDTTANKCVACLSGATDNCAAGQYCDDADHSCKTGCKATAECTNQICTKAHLCQECDPAGVDTCAAGRHCMASGDCAAGCKTDGSDCGSGKCNANHECDSCVADSECLPGNLCATGTCLPDCSHDDGCTTGLTCCGTRCANLLRDTRACLACGTACDSDQFCGIAGCSDGILGKVCDSAAATFLTDGLDIDDAQDIRLRDGFLDGCAHKPTVRVLSQADADTVNGMTGQPYVGSGDMQVIVGGPYGQQLIRYLENTGATRIYNTFDGNGAQFHLRGADGGAGTVIVDGKTALLTDQHDWFLIETVVDPTSGTLMFAVDGFTSIGTVAATFFFLNTMLPALATFDQSYYIYEWTNADGDPNPSKDDTFKLVTSGH